MSPCLLRLPDPAKFNAQSIMELATAELLSIHETMTDCGVPTVSADGAVYSASQRVDLFIGAWSIAGKVVRKAAKQI